MATERENQTSMTLQTDLKLNSVKSSLVSNAPSGQIQKHNDNTISDGIAYNKGGVPVGNSLNERLRGTKILLYGRGLKYFSPLRGTKILLYGRGLKYFSPQRDTNSNVTAFLSENSYCGTF